MLFIFCYSYWLYEQKTKIIIINVNIDITEFKENVLNINAPNNMAYQYMAKIGKNTRRN